MVLVGGTDIGGWLADTWELTPACTSPSITSQPGPATACAAGSATFSISASGSAPLSYQWQVQTAPNTWADLTTDPLPLPCGGAARATAPAGAQTDVAITPCPGVVAYQLRCLVSNTCGSATSNETTYSVCAPNCDCSTAAPVLNINDFICFQSRFAAADPAANCDRSTTPPILNINDFICFQTSFAAGCP
jgi:hypothetical protein